MPDRREESAYLTVWVQPGASRERVVRTMGEAVKVTVTAPPERGKANKAVRKLIAGQFGIPAGSVEVAFGAGSRRKVLRLRGVSHEQVCAWCARQGT